MSKTSKEFEKLGFEDALKELEGIVRKLEGGNLDLDTSIEQYKRGSLLKQHCEKKLAEAKLKVEKIMKNPDGSLTTEESETE